MHLIRRVELPFQEIGMTVWDMTWLHGYPVDHFRGTVRVRARPFADDTSHGNNPQVYLSIPVSVSSGKRLACLAPRACLAPCFFDGISQYHTIPRKFSHHEARHFAGGRADKAVPCGDASKPYELNVWAMTCGRAKERTVSVQDELAAKRRHVPPSHAFSGSALHTRHARSRCAA